MPTSTSSPTPVTFSADFTSSAVDGLTPLDLTLMVDSPVPQASYTWTVSGSDLTASGSEVTITIEEAGVFTITLTATWDDQTLTSNQTIIVRPGGFSADSGGILLADFQPSEYAGSAPLTVTFENLSLGDIDTVEWDFDGDGEIDSTEPDDPSFTYTEEGIFEATLTVYDTKGDSDTISYEIEVGGIAPEATAEVDVSNITQAAFSVDRLTAVAPALLTFADESTGLDLLYRWDFDGDAITDSTDANPEPFMYTNPGRYTVTLTIVDGEGTLSRTTQAVSILRTDNFNEIEADFSASPARGSAPLFVRFTNESVGEVATYAWDFNGDGITDSTVANPGSYQFTTSGIYDATLTITSAGGFEKTASISIV
ncbi:MAG: PKD domain-containing protein, partial [Chloroflexota bacterium]